MFEDVEVRGVDQLMALMQAFRADPREDKVDLVVGVYMNDAGDVPVMRAVKAAEARLVDGEDSKNYVGMMGDPAFTSRMPGFVLGEGSPVVEAERAVSVQTVGGSGALRVGCDLIANLNPAGRIWMSNPSWANHAPIANAARLDVNYYPYFRPSDRGLDFDGMMTHLSANAQKGDTLLLHACCHNPTGVDLSFEQWKTVTDLVVERGLLPFVDCAYQGLGQGLTEDVQGLRHLAERVPEALIATSFSKSFAIYRERSGALTVMAGSAKETATTIEALKSVIRPNYSMPPSHGARIVATVLGDPDLEAQWRDELTEMRDRITTMRKELRDRLHARQVTQDLSFFTDQKGMFSYTGLGPDAVARLRDEFGIYIAGDGRINVAGLGSGNLDVVADGFAAVMRDD